MAISLNKAITRNSDNTITTTTNYNELNLKASALVEDVVGKVETELASAETQINSQIGALQSAEEYATSAASSAASASQIALGQSTGRANIKPVLNLDFANQKRLDSKVDFTRTSTATYYDGKKMAKAEENLIIYSDGLIDNGWISTRGTLTQGFESYNGTLTAYEFSQNIGETNGAVLYRGYTFNNEVYTTSIYAKANTKGFIVFKLNSIDTSKVWFDLSNGLVGSNIKGYTADIIDKGNGWYRCTVTTDDRNTAYYWYIADTDGSSTVVDDGGSIYIANPQLEQRDFATAYTPTTDKPITNYIPVLSTAQANEPRFDYDLETKECKGLLIEEQRTNLISNSENYLALTQSGVATKEVLQTPISEDTHKYIATSQGYNQIYYNNNSLPSVIGTTYTASIFVKPINTLYFAIRTTLLTQAEYAYIDANSGEVLSSGDKVKVTVEKIGNGWLRISNTTTAEIETSQLPIKLYASNSATVYYSGVEIGSGFYYTGLQLEQGSFATSYIPTNGSQVTRTADNCSISGDNFSSFYNPSEGTFYADTTFLDGVRGGTYARGGGAILVLSNINENAYNNGFALGYYETTQSYIHFAKTGLSTDFMGPRIDDKNIDQTEELKVSISYTATTASLNVNGLASSSRETSPTKNPYNKLSLTHSYSDSKNGHIKKLAYYDKALSDTELQLMTEV